MPLAGWTGIEYFDGSVGTTGLSISQAVDQVVPLAGLEDGERLLAELGVGAEQRVEADVDVVVVVGHRHVFAAESSSEMIWCGCIVPWSSIRRRTVISVMPPGSWWPRIGMPLIAAMSTALPEVCSETLPEVVS